VTSPRVLIIAPTRELVVQIEADAKLLGKYTPFRILAVYGGIDYHRQRDALAQRFPVTAHGIAAHVRKRSAADERPEDGGRRRQPVAVRAVLGMLPPVALDRGSKDRPLRRLLRGQRRFRLRERDAECRNVLLPHDGVVPRTALHQGPFHGSTSPSPMWVGPGFAWPRALARRASCSSSVKYISGRASTAGRGGLPQCP